jgi:hypothetical protein
MEGWEGAEEAAVSGVWTKSISLALFPLHSFTHGIFTEVMLYQLYMGTRAKP